MVPGRDEASTQIRKLFFGRFLARLCIVFLREAG